MINEAKFRDKTAEPMTELKSFLKLWAREIKGMNIGERNSSSFKNSDAFLQPFDK